MLSAAEIARLIDHSLLHPTMTDQELESGCRLALEYEVASVCTKPYAVAQAVRWLAGSPVAAGTVVGFPHGNSAVAIKAAETRQACSEGATEIDMVVNIGKVLSREWGYVRDEIGAVLEETRRGGGLLKVIFENDFLPEDEYKIRLCELCSELGADFVKTSTGYGFVKGPDGRYDYRGATDHDLRLMRLHSAPAVQVKAAGGIRTLDQVLHVHSLGVTRVGASATAAILSEARHRKSGDAREFRAERQPDGY
ncbi:MAG: deoxyribose-phosphate aldolase [Bacteroidia bacterium]|nr:deoxyribose-phosphate aldolase [Bacteroidia bacterium]